MNRSDFIKSVGLGAGGLILPNSYIIGKPIKVYDNYVRGLAHYQFGEIKKSVKEGNELLLVREHQNLYDSFAIQVNYKEYRIGYIATYENIVLANMLDAGVNLTAFVNQKDLNRSLYESLAVEVYAEMVQPTQKLIESMLAERRADDASDIYRSE